MENKKLTRRPDRFLHDRSSVIPPGSLDALAQIESLLLKTRRRLMSDRVEERDRAVEVLTAVLAQFEDL